MVFFMYLTGSSKKGETCLKIFIHNVYDDLSESSED